MSTAAIFVSFVVSTIGLSLFIYGKKQVRLPQLVVGMLLMVCPFAVHDALWMAITSAALVGGLTVAVRQGL